MESAEFSGDTCSEVLSFLADSSARSQHQLFAKFDEACSSFKVVKSVTDKKVDTFIRVMPESCKITFTMNCVLKNLICRISEFLNDARIIRFLDSNSVDTQRRFGSDLSMSSQKENVCRTPVAISAKRATNWTDLFSVCGSFNRIIFKMH